jgi:putative transposase
MPSSDGSSGRAPAARYAAASGKALEEPDRPERQALGHGRDSHPVSRRRLAHLAAVIDCHDREIVGWEFALRGRAKEAERALDEACLGRFGTLRPHGSTPVLRSDNGLIFQSRRFREACRDYRLRQEFTTPYMPEQNGLIERFFRSLKEECTRQTNFRSFREAKRAVGQWIEWYNASRPHQALGYLSPREYRAQQLNSVAC